VGPGDVVVQNGPQCFDVSVWQLVGALTVGGRTLIVDQDVILDVERFVDTVVDGRATTLQVVPSYLDVLVGYLEQHPRDLPDLRTVCPTGDFLKKELVQRWFAVQPGIPLVNTYGLTETSDDAVHAVMDRVPDGVRVPLGRPIQNVRVYVTDDDLRPVPLGAPGLIVFSGVCVGRGYVNDAARTGAMFGEDPHHPGDRVCRTGDHGRWMVDGTLDFLGRRDNQVKVRGFRIEIGEVENALLRVPGVRDGAVVVAERPDRSRYLVAFCAGPRPLDGEAVREELTGLLPEYMVPTVVQWRESLPLTPNGKIDRTALTGLAAAEAEQRSVDAPETPTERRLAAAWAAVLGVPSEQIGRTDSFVDRGGTSLSAVKLAIALDRAVSPADLARCPVLADLAALVDGRSGPEPPRGNGALPPAPAVVPS
jgi:acyl-coenzyme A synthetase/AMP-(fatty) acid ligase